jgi:hypothetical protein
MSEAKTQCVACRATILQRTADRNDGLCAPCHSKAAAIPPCGFEIPSDIAERLDALDEDPADYREMAWQCGADFVRGFIDKREQRDELYRKWSPRLRAFAVECRKSRPIPNVNSLNRCDREKQRIYKATLHRRMVVQDMTVAICEMPLIAMPIAQRLWPSDDERVVLLTPEEQSRWNEMYSHPKGAFWWFAYFWWKIEESPELEFAPTHPNGQEPLWWNDDDVPNGECPWLLSVGASYGPLAGSGHQELWLWNGRRAKFIKNVSTWIS